MVPRGVALDTILQPNGRAMSAGGKCAGATGAPTTAGTQAAQAGPPARFHSVTVPPRELGSCVRPPLDAVVEPVTRQAAMTRSFSAAVPSAGRPTVITRQASQTTFVLPASKAAPESAPPAQPALGDGKLTRPMVAAVGSKDLEQTRGRTMADVKATPKAPTAPPAAVCQPRGVAARVTPRASCGGIRRHLSQPVLPSGRVSMACRPTPCGTPCGTPVAPPPVWSVAQPGQAWRPRPPPSGTFAPAMRTAAYRPVVPMMCGSMQVPLPCNRPRDGFAARFQGPGVSGESLMAEIDRQYPVTLLVHEIVEEVLHDAPEAFQAPELRRDLKPRLRAVILEALQGGAVAARSRNPNDRVILGVALYNAEAWGHFARASRRQCAQSGLSRDLAVRVLEAVRRFLGLDHLPEDSPERFWDLQPDQPLHQFEDLAPLLCSQSTWQEEELPARRELLQEPITATEALALGNGCGTSPSSTLDFAWLLPGQSPGEFKERTVEALLQLPGVHARASDPENGAAQPAPRSPGRRRAGPYDHIQARIDTNLPESVKSSPRSSRSPSRHRSTSPRVTKLLLPTGSNPGSPRGSVTSRGSGRSPRRSASNGARSEEEQLSKELSTSSRPASARSARSARSASGQFRQPAPWRN